MSNDIDYANADFIPGAAAYPPRWAADAAAFREAMTQKGRAILARAYGPGPRQAFDLFFPAAPTSSSQNAFAAGAAAGPGTGVLVFVHGGYWRRFDRTDWSHFTAGALARGWAVALPGYTLVPAATIPEITREIATALVAIASAVPGPIHLAGHSAGGHLVARMLCADVALPPAVTARITGCTPISPVADLRPLIDTAMNADLRLTPDQARAESPCLRPKARDVPVTVWVGAVERPVFLDQARWLADAWNADLRIDPGRHHFDVIDGLADPGSPLMNAIVGGQDPNP